MNFRDLIRIRFPLFYQWLVFFNNTIFPARFCVKSFSQFGEDLLVSHLLNGKQKGTYVDVGAFRPVQCSNTYYFYRKGWKGINIDAMPGSMRLFNAVRPRDTNLEIPVADTDLELTYYIFNYPLMNGFFKDDSSIPAHLEGLRIVDKKIVRAQRLDQILDEHLNGDRIDLMSIDVEGLDFSVLRSNNWEKYQPTVILIEILDFNFQNLEHYEIYSFLTSLGYQFYSRTVHTLIFKKHSDIRGSGYVATHAKSARSLKGTEETKGHPGY